MAMVSVIIPTYNRCEFVKEAVESVLQQSLTDFEILVIDDGSTDNTALVIQNIRDHRVKYFYKENNGASGARNWGLTKAKGKYLAFLDSDDLWPRNYLETMVQHLEEQPMYGAIYSQIRLLLHDGKTEPFGYQHRFDSGQITSDFFSGGLCILPSASIFRSQFWKDFWWDEALTNCFDDFDVFLRLSIKTKFLFVPDIYAIRRENSGSISNMAGRTISPYGPLIMERFCKQVDITEYMPEKKAKRKISHRYRSLAKQHLSNKNKRAVISLTIKAISLCPLDFRLYLDLLRAFFLNKDSMEDWKMPEALPLHITVSCDTKTK